jgi:hypothetical protein
MAPIVMKKPGTNREKEKTSAENWNSEAVSITTALAAVSTPLTKKY